MSELVTPEQRPNSPVLPETEATVSNGAPASTESTADVYAPETTDEPASEPNLAALPLAHNAIHLSGMTAQELVASAAEKAAEAATADVRDLHSTVRESGLAHIANAKTAAAEMLTSAQQSAAVIERAVGEARAEVLDRNGKLFTAFQENITATASEARTDITSAAAEAQTDLGKAAEAAQSDILAAKQGVVDEGRRIVQVVNEGSIKVAEAGREVAEATRQLERARDTVVQEAVTKTLLAMANGDDEAQVQLMRRAKESLDDMNMPRHRQTPLLYAAVRAGVNAYLVGQTGSGKSTGARLVARDLGIDFESLSIGGTIGKADFFGFRDANGYVHRTGLREIVEKGGIYLIDEIDTGHPGALTLLNQTLANGHTNFPDGRKRHHENTRFVGAANTIGKGATGDYVGRNRLDGATLDRFAFIEWDIDPALEEAIVLGEVITKEAPLNIQQGGVPKPFDWLRVVRAYRETSETLKLRQIVSPRASEDGVALSRVELENGKVGVGLAHLVKMLIHKGMQEDVARRWDRAAGVRY